MSGNPLRDADRRDDRETRALSKYPRCVFCRYPIQTEMIYAIDDCGQYACEDCINERGQHLDQFMMDREMDGGLWDGIL